MNIYFKNFGIWLGGPILLSYLLSFAGFYSEALFWLLFIGGTIVGIIQSHKDNGGRINFGKAVGASFLIVVALFLLTLIISLVRFGMMPVDIFLEYWFLKVLIIRLLIVVSFILAAGRWYMYQKAGKQGWECIVPIYNMIVLLDIAKRPTWWFAMFFVPIANIIFMIKMMNGVSQNFGKSSGFTVGLVLLQDIFVAVLGFGSANYLGEGK